MRKQLISKAKRIVVKVGTNALMGTEMNRSFIANFAEEISSLRKSGKEIIVITSGAIGFGSEKLGMNGHDLPLEMQQATASVGQNILMREYEKAFNEHKQVIAQILLSQNTFSSKKSFENLKHTMEKLLELNVIPIINENDAIYVEELETPEGFSDNDGLAALVAKNFGADFMVILTDVEGLYNDNPKSNGNAEFIDEVHNLDEINALCGEASCGGIGGFKSKISAVKKSGVFTVIAKARKGIIGEIFEAKGVGTAFYPNA